MGLDGYFDTFTQRDWQTIDDGHVRIPVVGLGRFARNRALPAIRDAHFCESTVVVSSSPETATDLAKEFDVSRVLTYGEFQDGICVSQHCGE